MSGPTRSATLHAPLPEFSTASAWGAFIDPAPAGARRAPGVTRAREGWATPRRPETRGRAGSKPPVSRRRSPDLRRTMSGPTPTRRRWDATARRGKRSASPVWRAPVLARRRDSRFARSPLLRTRDNPTPHRRRHRRPSGVDRFRLRRRAPTTWARGWTTVRSRLTVRARHRAGRAVARRRAQFLPGFLFPRPPDTA